MSFWNSAKRLAVGVAKSEGKRLAGMAKNEGKRMAMRGVQSITDRYLGGCVGMGVKRRKGRLVKGSAAAKAHMAKLRSIRTCIRRCRV